MDLNSILTQFKAGSKETVYLSVTPGVGLELIQLDTNGHTVKNYAYRPLQYNDSLREIADMEAFKTAMVALFEELHISLKSSVVLNLPMVLLGSKELTLLVGDDGITEALTSEVEQSYIFRRYEPVISWVDPGLQQSGDMRKLFYSAIQKNAIDDIQAVFAELGTTLAGIEISLTSLLKSLSYCGLTQEQMKDGVSWNLMIINSNGYSIISMLGKTIMDYYEEPLALKSFEGEEIYNAINASAQIALMSYPANYLFIVSETDLVSAELLAGRIQGAGIVNYWENNSYKKQDALPVSLEILEEAARKISLQAIGVAAPESMPIKFDFFKDSSAAVVEDPNQPVTITIGGAEYAISPNNARNIACIAMVVLILPFLISFVVFPNIEKQKQSLLDDVNNRLQSTNAQIKAIEDARKSGQFDPIKEIKRVLADNRTKLIGYSALGEAVPRKLWVTSFTAKGDGKFDIKGEAENVEDIYTFFRNMKDSLLNTQLRIHKLEMKTNSVDEAVSEDMLYSSDYRFEITNMSDAELAPPADDKKSDKPKK